MRSIFKQSPGAVSADDLGGQWDTDVLVTVDNTPRWVPGRPAFISSLKTRFKLAFDVFRGKADALYWTEQ
jgi:hypothetical protein